jgi:hypothetical protein
MDITLLYTNKDDVFISNIQLGMKIAIGSKMYFVEERDGELYVRTYMGMLLKPRSDNGVTISHIKD